MTYFLFLLGSFVSLASGLRLQNTKIRPEIDSEFSYNTAGALSLDDHGAGPLVRPEALRYTLIATMHMFRNESIPFVPVFGTLLHLVREEDLIQADDDVDVLVRASDIPRIRSMLLAYGLKLRFDKPHFLRTESMEASGGAPLDIYSDGGKPDYVCVPQDKKGYPRTMLEPYASRQFTLNGTTFTLDIPREPENFLRASYGDHWRIPSTSHTGAFPDFFAYWDLGCEQSFGKRRGKRSTKVLEDAAEETETNQNLQPEPRSNILALKSYSTTQLGMATGV